MVISFRASISVYPVLYFLKRKWLWKAFIIDSMVKILPIFSQAFQASVISALAYASLFYINSLLTSELVFGLGVNWIYLPAGLRLFLTLIFGLPGAIGISLASFLISYLGEFPHDLTLCLGVGLISGFAPYIARGFIFGNIDLQSDLGNLSIQKLMSCILVYALLCAGLHQLWYAAEGLENAGTFNHFLVMFIGDVLGSILLIAVIKYALDILKKARKRVY